MVKFKKWLCALLLLDYTDYELELLRKRVNLQQELLTALMVTLTDNSHNTMNAIQTLNANLDTLKARVDAVLPTVGGVPQAEVQAAAGRVAAITETLPALPITETATGEPK